MSDMIEIDGKKFRKFIRYPKPVKDGTPRCIQCGQIDEPEYHDDAICRAAWNTRTKDAGDE